MRKLGIIIALTAAATLGLAGFAGPASADQHEPVCAGIDQATTPFIEGGLPLDDTQAGVVKDCMTSGAPVAGTGINAFNTLCGLEKDVAEEINEQLGHDGIGGVHGGLDDLEDQAEGAGFPNVVNLDHPCGGGGCTENCGGGPPPGGDDDNGGGGGGVDPAVQAASAGADGGLPRTGGELFAGAGFAVMSLGALVRRFIR